MSEWKKILNYDLLEKALIENNFTKPTEIQSKVIPLVINENKDVFGAARTGSGKTFAFALPILKFIDQIKKIKQDSKLRALIIAPTRELVVQIHKHIENVSKYIDVKSLILIGGLTIEKQHRLLKRKPDIIIGTPGRLWEIIDQDESDYLNEKSVKATKFLVIDEFDKMIEKNHFEELQKIINLMLKFKERNKRRILVFSATLTYVIKVPERWKLNKKKINQKITLKSKLHQMKKLLGIKEDAEVIDLTQKGIGIPSSEQLTEYTISCLETEKDFYLYYILATSQGKTLVFCNSKDCVRKIVAILKLLNIDCVSLHSELEQKNRLKNLEKFSNSKDTVLIASDIAARGLDIENIERVIHYQIPHTVESYVHRSGRTARGFNRGISIMLYDPKESKLYRRLQQSFGNKLSSNIFPINKRVFEIIKNRMKIAQNLNLILNKINKQKSRKNWFMKMAQECEIDLDGRKDIINEDDKNNRDNDKIKKLSKQLKEIMTTKISKYISFQNYLQSLNCQKITIN